MRHVEPRLLNAKGGSSCTWFPQETDVSHRTLLPTRANHHNYVVLLLLVLVWSTILVFVASGCHILSRGLRYSR